jgi:mannosyltransferase
VGPVSSAGVSRLKILSPSSDHQANVDATGRAPLSTSIRRAKSEYVLIAGVCAITGFLGAFRLGTKSIWTDEAFSVAVARLGLPTIARMLTHAESFNGLYYILLHFWQLGGDSETWLRLPSVVFGVLAVFVLFALTRRLFGLRVALIAATLLAVNSFFVYYEQDVRPYSLAVFLVVLATFLFVKAVEDPSLWRWLGYGVVGALAVYAHLFAAFVLFAHLSSLLIRRPRPRLRDLAAAYGLIALVVAPLLTVMVRTDPLSREFIDQPHLGSFRWLFLNLTGGGGLATTGSFALLVAYFVACCLGLLWILRAVIDRKAHRETGNGWPYGLILSWLSVPILGSFAVSMVRAPIFYPRYLIVALPPLVTLAAIGISGLPHGILRAVALAAVVALALPPLVSNYRRDFKEGEDWRRAVAYVTRAELRGDGIVFLTRYGRRPFEYYLERMHGEADLRSIYPDLPWGAYVPVLSDLHGPWSTATAAKRLPDAHGRVWVILTWQGFDSVNEDANPLRAELQEDYRVAAEQQFGQQVQVRLYQRTES